MPLIKSGGYSICVIYHTYTMATRFKSLTKYQNAKATVLNMKILQFPACFSVQVENKKSPTHRNMITISALLLYNIFAQVCLPVEY